MFVLPRLPFREDKVFSLLFLIVLTVPLVFTWQTYEKYETVKLAVWLFLLGWIFLLFLFKKQSLSPDSRANWLLVGFLGFGLVSAFLGYSRLNGFLGLYPRFTSGFVFYFLWIATLFFFIGVLNRQKWQVLLRLLFFDGVLVAIVGVLQSYGVGFYTGIDQAAVSRAPGLLGNPNFSSMFLAVILPFTLPLSISAKKVAAKLYYALGSLVMLWAVVNFSSRGAWLGLGAAFLFMVGVLAVKRTRKKLILSIVSFAAIFAILLSFTLHVVRPGSIESVVRMSETNIDLRFFAWNVAIDIIGKHPVLGFGPGSLQNYFEQFRGSNLAMQSGIFDDAHNLFLQLAATTGLPSALIFIGLLLLACYRMWPEIKSDQQDFWALAAVTSVIGWVVASCFTPVSLGCYLALAVVLGGMLEREVKVFWMPGWGWRGIFFGLGVVMTIGACLFFLAELLFYRGLLAYNQGQYNVSIKSVNAAVKINPFNQLYFLYKAADDIILFSDQSKLESDLKKIFQLEPGSARSQVMAANLYFLMYDRTGDINQLNKSINAMEKSLLIDKYSPGRYVHAAFYKAQAGKLDEARELAKAGLMLDFKYVPGWLLLSRIYQLEGKEQQMLYALENASKSLPDNQGLKDLYQEAQKSSERKKLLIPAFINIYNLEP